MAKNGQLCQFWTLNLIFSKGSYKYRHIVYLWIGLTETNTFSPFSSHLVCILMWKKGQKGPKTPFSHLKMCVTLRYRMKIVMLHINEKVSLQRTHWNSFRPAECVKECKKWLKVAEKWLKMPFLGLEFIYHTRIV